MSRRNCFIRMHYGVYESIRVLADGEKVDINVINDRVIGHFLGLEQKPLFCVATPRGGIAKSNWVNADLYMELEPLSMGYNSSINQVFYTACVSYMEHKNMLNEGVQYDDRS